MDKRLPIAAVAALLDASSAASAQQQQPTLPLQQSPAASPSSPAGSQSASPAQAAGSQAATSGQPGTAPATLGEWASGIKLSFQGDAGITVNPATPRDGINFGHLLTDKANRPLLNQAVLGLARPLDPQATGYDLGFKLALLYGSDARLIHTLGVFDRLVHDRNQLDVEEADVLVHAPWLFAGGIDFKGGIWPTPLGAEVIDPKPNPFYSHSYIFNYGLPFAHTGVLAAAHVSRVLDLYLSVDSGANTSLGSGDNNDLPSGIAGFGLNLLGGKLTVVALTHLGPEDPKRSTPFADSALRYYNDVVLVWKATSKLTLTTDVNYVREEGFRAQGYGGAQYASYALSGALTLNGRAEVWRDNNNFFVSVPVNNLDYVDYERGVGANLYTAPRPTTYSEFTVGVTYAPQGLPKSISALQLRPELRYDRSLNGTHPYNDGRDAGQFTLGADVILGF